VLASVKQESKKDSQNRSEVSHNVLSQATNLSKILRSCFLFLLKPKAEELPESEAIKSGQIVTRKEGGLWSFPSWRPTFTQSHRGHPLGCLQEVMGFSTALPESQGVTFRDI
jgi:hypothetical protein